MNMLKEKYNEMIHEIKNTVVQASYAWFSPYIADHQRVNIFYLFHSAQNFMLLLNLSFSNINFAYIPRKKLNDREGQRTYTDK